MKRFVLSLSILALASACGGDDGGGPPIENPAAQMAANQSVDSTLELETLKTDPGNDAAIGNLNGTFGQLSTVLNAKVAAQNPQAAALLETSRITGACLTSDANGATYDNCDFGSGTIDGTISLSGNTVSVDLTIVSTSSGTTTIEMVGSLTITTSELTGSLSYTVTSDAGGQNLTYDIDADYDITLTDGCATGGTLDIDGSWETQGYSQSARVRATFGPNCGDVVLN